MYRGLVISVVFHVGLLAWALISIHNVEPPKPPELEAVAVSIISPDDITRLKQGDRNAKQLEAQPVESKATEELKKEREKPKPKAANEPPPPPPEPEPPEPEPKAAEAPPPEPPKDPIAEKLAAPPPPEPKPGPTPEEIAAKQQAEEAARKAAEADAAKKAAAEAEAKRKAEAKKKADELRKKKLAEAKKKREEDAKRKAAEAAKRKKEFDADKLAALLNKIPDSGGPRPAAEPSPVPTKNRGPVAGAPEGRDDRLTASEMALLGAMIRRGVQPCWRVLGGGQGAEAMAVKMRIQFNQDGTLRGDPQIMNPQASPFFVAAADSAKRAVIQCQPYNLPAAKYTAWQDVILNFDPKDMF